MVNFKNTSALCVGLISLASLGACTPTRLPHDSPIYVEFDTSGVPPVIAPNTPAIPVPIDPPAPLAKPATGNGETPAPQPPPSAALTPSPNALAGRIMMPNQQAVTDKKSPSGTMVLTGTLRAIEHRDGRSCAEPAPDVGLSTAAALAFAAQASADTAGGVAKPSVNGSLNESIASTALALAGRNSTVLLARDLTFRLCELSLNYPPGSAEFATGAQELQRIIDLVKVIAETESKQADIDKKAADTDKANADTLKNLAAVRVLAELPSERDKKISSIVSKFAPTGAVDSKAFKAAMDPLVAKNQFDQITENDLLAATTSDDLKQRLLNYGDPVITYIFSTI